MPGIQTESSKERTEEISMPCKLTDKNLEALTPGEKDSDLGLALPGSSGMETGKSCVKDEMPSLPLVQAELETPKRTYLLHT